MDGETNASLSLMDSRFSESNTSLTISSINNTHRDKKISLPPLSTILTDSRHYSRDNYNHERDPNNDTDYDFSLGDNENNYNNYNNNNNTYKNNNVLDNLYTTPKINNYGGFDEINTPDTPITPLTPSISEYRVNNKNRYPLNNEKLQKFELNPTLFKLELQDKFGKGSNAYVYSCQLSTNGISNSSFNIAVKIPISKNKVKYIIQEAKFAMKLREYQQEWFKKENRVYPFIDCYGLYYLNKNDFQLFKPNDEFPCLVMKKMSFSLKELIRRTSIINSQQRKTSTTLNLKINKQLWWKLYQTLNDALSILKSLESVHCDLKTDNIMVSAYGDSIDDIENIEFKIIDFSSANEIKELVKCPDTTLQYSAPELMNFQTNRIPTYLSDKFSAGLILLEAATGSPPYSLASYDNLLLLTAVKEGKPFEWLSAEDYNVLEAHPDVVAVLKEMLYAR